VSSSYGILGVSTALATISVPWLDSSPPSTENGSGYSMTPPTTASRDRRAFSRSRTSDGCSRSALPGTRPLGSGRVMRTPSSS
jgi:hypothetical protein